MNEFQQPRRIAPDVFEPDDTPHRSRPKDMFTPGERVVYVESQIEKALVALQEGNPEWAARMLQATRAAIAALKLDLPRSQT